LNTAIVDSWTFGTGEIEIVNFPNFENKNSDALSAFGDRITQHQNNISSYDEQINALPSLDDIQKTIDDAVKEYRELQNSTPRTAEAVQNRQERLSYLKEFR
jgi:peptidoglycan hydrolase CwlO-like protein